MLTAETIEQINVLAIGEELALPDGRRIRCEKDPEESCVDCALCSDYCGDLDCCGDFRTDGTDVWFHDITEEA